MFDRVLNALLAWGDVLFLDQSKIKEVYNRKTVLVLFFFRKWIKLLVGTLCILLTLGQCKNSKDCEVIHYCSAVEAISRIVTWLG